MKRLFPIVAAAFASLIAAPLSSAAITSSQITTPAATTHLVSITGGDPLPASIAVRGTTDSTAPGTDTVDIVCMRARSRYTVAAAVTLAADGSFSTTLPMNDFQKNSPCRLRAMPNPGSGVDDYAAWRYAGPVIVVSWYTPTNISGGPNDGALLAFNFNLYSQRGYFNLDTIGDSAINAANPISDGLIDDEEADVMNRGFALLESSPFAGYREQSAIRVDGVSAYTTEGAWIRAGGDAGGGRNAPGLPRMTAALSIDAETGPVLVETADLAACSDETQANCPSFTPLPVRIIRTYRLSPDGRRVRLADQIVSTDGASHAVVLDYTVDALDQGEDGFLANALRGSADVDVYNGNSGPIDLGEGPQTVMGRFYAQLDSGNNPVFLPEQRSVATTWRTTPDLVVFRNRGFYYGARFARTVPASGDVTIEMAMSIGMVEADTRAAALDQEDAWSSPAVTIDAPADGAVTTGASAVVTGTSTGRTLLGVMRTPIVMVNGVAANVTSDGRWSVELPLRRGTNEITATATNSVGTTATATRTINRGAKARRLTATVTSAERVRARSGARSVVVRGKLTRPAGVAASSGCAGMVRATVRVGKRQIATRWATLRPTCAYAIKVPLPRRGAAQIAVRFMGNPSVLQQDARALRIRAGR